MHAEFGCTFSTTFGYFSMTDNHQLFTKTFGCKHLVVTFEKVQTSKDAKLDKRKEECNVDVNNLLLFFLFIIIEVNFFSGKKLYAKLITM